MPAASACGRGDGGGQRRARRAHPLQQPGAAGGGAGARLPGAAQGPRVGEF